MKFASLFLFCALALTGCSKKVLVKKDTCKDVYDGLLMECEKVDK
jgi:hypothetical protein